MIFCFESVQAVPIYASLDENENENEKKAPVTDKSTTDGWGRILLIRTDMNTLHFSKLFLEAIKRRGDQAKSQISALI